MNYTIVTFNSGVAVRESFLRCQPGISDKSRVLHFDGAHSFRHLWKRGSCYRGILKSTHAASDIRTAEPKIQKTQPSRRVSGAVAWS